VPGRLVSALTRREERRRRPMSARASVIQQPGVGRRAAAEPAGATARRRAAAQPTAPQGRVQTLPATALSQRAAPPPRSLQKFTLRPGAGARLPTRLAALQRVRGRRPGGRPRGQAGCCGAAAVRAAVGNEEAASTGSSLWNNGSPLAAELAPRPQPARAAAGGRAAAEPLGATGRRRGVAPACRSSWSSPDPTPACSLRSRRCSENGAPLVFTPCRLESRTGVSKPSSRIGGMDAECVSRYGHS
jgi:hypothetical protein